MQKILTQYVIPLVLLVLGIVFLILGFNNVQQRKEYVTTTAVISRIDLREEVGTDGEIETTGDVYVDYTVNGKKYTNDLGEYSSSFTEGAEIEIYYNPKNPNEIFSASVIFPIIMFVLGGVFCLVGLVVVIKLIVLVVVLKRT